MNHLSLDEYPRKWIFTHASMPLPEGILASIKPFTQARSSQLWREHISAMSPDADRLASDDWAGKEESWKESVLWQEAWESDEPELPEEVLAFITWEDNTPVYFCYEKYNVIETTWGVFKQAWKNFLFFDDGPILIGRRKKEALWFDSEGYVQLGLRE
ncbi:DUF2947 domain-containing protein [Thaumasiovibrio subtropicus]|uniref:DUF2947 domain-containing protein n=1 Tax=Thaumasiovibrio subtropicus TaxID=1891207 RepID=UPI000B35E549|nr:DUF2947 domain-containing protein [Thaumasiovibrio subtropicus]